MKDNCKKEINKINKLRENHYNHYTDREWKDSANYDICLNSDEVGIEKSVDIICQMASEK